MNTVGELVKAAEAQLTTAEEELKQMWSEWEAAEAEVQNVYRQDFPRKDADTKTSDEADPLAELLAQLRDAIEVDITEAEERASQLSEAAVDLMKEIEKVRLPL